LRDHVVDETVLVIDTRFLKLFLVFAVMQVRAKLSYSPPGEWKPTYHRSPGRCP
jgi:hypothetical protein